MLISHSHKFIFVHIYKTAGSSLEKVLMPACSFRYSRKCRLKHLLHGWPAIFSDDFHRHADAIELKNSIPPAVFESYLTFAIVRNPFDWLVSLYHYICQHPEHHQHLEVLAMNSFETFVRWRSELNARTQKSFIYTTDGQCIVDVVGKCESIDAAYAIIAAKVGLQAQKIPRTNVSKRLPAASYFNNSLRELVVDHWQEDFEAFGYEPRL